MNTNRSPVHSLQKLKDLLDSGALTPREYESLKSKLFRPAVSAEGADAVQADQSPGPGRFLRVPTPGSQTPSNEAAGSSAPLGTGQTLPKLEVDHLLGPQAPEEVEVSPLFVPTIPAKETAPAPEGLRASQPVKRFEPRPGNVLRFNPLRGREPSPPWYQSNIFNYLLVGCLLALIGLGGYLLFGQTQPDTERIASIRTDRSGGVVLGEAEATLPPLAPDPAGQDGTAPALDFEELETVPPVVEPEPEAASIPVAEPEPEAIDPDPNSPDEILNEEDLEEEPMLLEEETTLAEEPVDPAATEPAEDSPALLPGRNRDSAASGAVPAPAAEPALRTDSEGRIIPLSDAGSGPSKQEVLTRIENRLQSYYQDFQALPFAAHHHFAPQVERYYTLTNVSPREIQSNLESYHFKEFLQARSSFDPSSLQIVNQDNGAVEVVFVERGEAFRKSLNEHHRITARVRVKFNADYLMTYYRQERILSDEIIR